MGRASFVLLICLLWPVAGPAAPPDADLLQTQVHMNEETMEGGYVHVMHELMANPDMAYSFQQSHIQNLYELLKDVPETPVTGVVGKRVNMFALESADGSTAVTLVKGNLMVMGYNGSMPLAYYQDYVFGFRTGLWSAEWAPTGLPRHFDLRTLDVWQRVGPGGAWRLVGGPFQVRNRPGADLADSPLPAGMVSERLAPQPSATAARDAAYERDVVRGYPAALRWHGERSAFAAYWDPQVLVLHMDQQTWAGPAAFQALKDYPDREWMASPAGRTVAASGDFVVTYGYLFPVEGPDQPPHHVYTDVWCYSQGRWKVRVSFIMHLNGP